MKKRILLPIIALGALFCVGFGTIEYKAVKAEGEEPEIVEPAPVEEEPSNTEEVAEEQPNYEELYNEARDLYEKALAKYNKISNYQFLGTTVGALLGGLITLGVNWLIGKINREKLTKGLDDMRRYSEFIGTNGEKISDFTLKVEQYVADTEKRDEEAQKAKELAIQTINNATAKMDEQMKMVAKQKEEEIKSRLEERQFFLEIISHSKEMVSSGKAEELVRYFKNKED